jgi:hypothetical protein
MTDTAAPPTTATEARTRLDARKADPEWGKLYMDGNTAARREFKDLTTMIANGPIGDAGTDAVMSGKLPPGASSEQREAAFTAGMLRDLGFPPKAIRETISGKVPTPEDVERARLWKTQVMNNPDYTKRLLAGDGDARREMMAANIVLTSAPESVS